MCQFSSWADSTAAAKAADQLTDCGSCSLQFQNCAVSVYDLLSITGASAAEVTSLSQAARLAAAAGQLLKAETFHCAVLCLVIPRYVFKVQQHGPRQIYWKRTNFWMDRAAEQSYRQ